MMRPFLLPMAREMSLEHTLKLAHGPFAQEQIDNIISDLEAI
jgi:hypothetical protein